MTPHRDTFMSTLLRYALLSLTVLLAVPRTMAQPEMVGVWENVSFGDEGPAIGGEFVSALTVGSDGDVYAAGSFRVAGGVAAREVARWDGTNWHALGSGLESVLSGYPADVAAGPGGRLYAVGLFERAAGGGAAHYAAVWDGTSWTTFGAPLEGEMEAVAVGPDGVVYAAVNRYIPGSGWSQAGRVVRWDGTSWIPVGGEFTAEPGVTVLVYDLLVTPDGALYASGDFGVRRWAGTAWSPVGNGAGGRAATLVPDGRGGLYAGGDLVLGGATLAGVARWDGTVWTPLGSGPGRIERVFDLAADASGSVYASGWALASGSGTDFGQVARWDGTSWHPMPPGINRETVELGDAAVLALAIGPDGTLHIGGQFDRAGGRASPSLARWRNGVWLPGAGGINGLVRGLTHDASGRPVIGGAFGTAGGHIVRYVAARGPDGWRPMSSTIEYPVVDLERDRDGDLIACAYRMARWNGTVWSDAGLQPRYATCLALTTDRDRNVYAVGEWADGTPGGPTSVQRWDGTSWTSLGTPRPFAKPTSVAVDSSGTVYVGGMFGVARRSGGAWTNIGGVTGGAPYPYVFALTVGSDGVLYAGGRFQTIGGVAARSFARWDGVAWHPADGGVDGDVLALMIDGTRGIYVGGKFEAAGSYPAAHVALWDGAEWHSLGAGTDGAVYALERDGPDGLYVAGEFGEAGGTPSPYVARWAARPVAADPSPEAAALRLALAPNPARGAVSLLVAYPPGHATVDVFDALGRRVARVFDGETPGGEQHLSLDASRLAPGIYVVRLTADGRVATALLSVVR